MHLPRRVPWATLAELDQLCSWVYTEDASDRNLATERLSAWRFMMPLPHALESLLSILVTIEQDNASGAAGPSSLSLRQSYATALIRLVNGLVDPLQAGTYARSILSIAAQIGLPAWLVELRHAATHEDLPSLELLREGAKESLTWLLNNYFLPTLNPALASDEKRPPRSPPSSIRPVEPLLRRYKSLLKTVSRDASLRARTAADISGALREIERWLAEARVAAHTHASEFASWLPHRGRNAAEPFISVDAAAAADDSDDNDDEGPEPREAWALDRLCDALLVKGALVPLSRKKRVLPPGSALRHPPSPLVVVWVPLLESVATNHAHFPAVLTSHIITHLLAEDDDPPDDERDRRDRDDTTTVVAASERTSYDICLAAWGVWLVEWRRADESDADVAARRQDVFFQLVQALSGRSASAVSQPGARALLTALCTSDRQLAGISATILGAMHVPEEDAPVWCEADLDVMEARVKAARSLSRSTDCIQPQALDPLSEEEGGPPGEKKNLPDGWRLLSELGGWQPCPIGVYVDGE